MVWYGMISDIVWCVVRYMVSYGVCYIMICHGMWYGKVYEVMCGM